MTHNFGKQMDLLGQIQALIKVELHVRAERQMIEAELAKLREENNDENDS